MMKKVENRNVRMETVETSHRDRSESNLFKIEIENYFFFLRECDSFKQGQYFGS